MKRKHVEWVVMGGKEGEFCHCQRCGEGLSLKTPAVVEVVVDTMREFEKKHRECATKTWKPARPATPEEWRESRDTGTSSMTLASVLAGTRPPKTGYDAPYDSSDLARCMRFLELFPQFKTAINKMAGIPGWAGFVREWPRLEEMYKKAVSGDATNKDLQELYTLIQKLRLEDQRPRPGEGKEEGANVVYSGSRGKKSG
jgi:hypothetical protein